MTQVSDLNLIVIQKLINEGFIPPEGNFDIDENLLHAHRQIYATFGEGKTNKYLKARRYAGMGFIFLKKFRKLAAKDIKEGFVYLISNPAWQDKTKIGLTLNPKKRLSSYQTYDPYRSYKLESYEFVTNKQITEQNLLKEFSLETDIGEWVSDIDAEVVIREIRSEIEWKQGELIFKDKNGNPLRLGMKVKFQPIRKAIQYGIVKAFKESGLEIEGFITDTNQGYYQEILPQNVEII